MSNVITVENLGKRYTLHHQQREQYTALRDVITNSIASLGSRVLRPFKSSSLSLSPESEDFWALKDVSFEVKHGDRIGIIGRNGAGKSTLLKILSRITEPTTGSVRIKGRVASLLEVGTGFHPELTGRENIYLNGAILGMSRAEIRKKFDEIVDFAEIEKFLDTPVKRYSSGMYVRLAFAVAAHLEPEILVVDEVLAVGDAQFQKKCLGKMEDVSYRQGRTVLFVSHNMLAINELCNRAILLSHGNLTNQGETSEVIRSYVNLRGDGEGAIRDLSDFRGRNADISSSDSLFKWSEILMRNAGGDCVNELQFGEPFEVVFRGYASEECENIRIGFAINSSMIGLVFSTHQFYNGISDSVKKGYSEFTVRIPENYLAPGCYDICIAADGTSKVADYITSNALFFSISNVPYSEKRQWRPNINSGILWYPCQWSHKELQVASGERCRG